MIRNFNELIIKASNKFGNNKYLISANKKYKDYSFKELNKFRINLNFFLEKKSIKKKNKILVVMHNSNILSLLFLTIIANSRVFVPINPKLSIKEIEYVVNQTKPKLILCFSWYKKKFKNLKHIKSIFIKNEIKFINDILNTKNFKKNDEENYLKSKKDIVAQILFTSGSTGLPKGVILTQQSMLKNLYGINERLKIKNKRPRFLAVTPLFHNNGQFIPTLLPLLLGGTTTPIESETSIINFWGVASKNRIQYSSVMATHINYFLKHTSKPKSSVLECLFCGGAKLEEKIRQKFEKKFRIKVALNYGLTETSSIVSTESMEKKSRKNFSVGKPLYNNFVKIKKINKKDRSGEVLIKGENLFLNYLKKPKIYKSKFKNNWFKTGDLGYLDKDNFLYINSRIDDMIIVSGENVYPSDVEKYLYKFDEIDVGVLTSIPDEITQNKLLLIYESKNKIDITKLNRIMKKYVSSYKIPKIILNCNQIGLAEIPKAPNKKILRSKLKNYVSENYKLFKEF
ncbi:acyl--CoA ligase [Candidatus Pelagibacter sp.]|nr:acyl--CoA ligase [Candidatus Pelagibacter sp.]